MCLNNPNKVCDSNGHCGGACQRTKPSKPVCMVFDSIQWFKAMDYADLLRLLQQFSGQKVRLMGANTGTGQIILRITYGFLVVSTYLQYLYII